jgi:hypothetical protein
MQVKFTHAGWMMLCPILANFDEPDAPMIEPRHWTLQPLFWLSEVLEAARIRLNMWLDDEYEPTFMMRVAELDQPIVRNFSE